MTTVAQGTKEMYNDVLLTNLMLGKYRANNRAIETITFQIMQPMSEAESKKLNANMETLLTENNQYLNQLKQANLSQENKEIFQQVIDNYSNYSQQIMQVLSLGVQNKNKEALQYYKDHVEGVKDIIVQLGDKLEKNSKAYESIS